MIGRRAGTLLEKNPPQIVVEAGGVGYEVEVPMSTFYNLPASGERVTLLTHLVVREDAHLLYGFGTETERRILAHDEVREQRHALARGGGVENGRDPAR